MRQQSWRDYRAQAKAAGDADLRRAARRRHHREAARQAFETVCLLRRRRVPARRRADAGRQDDVEGARAVLERADGAAAGDDRSGDRRARRRSERCRFERAVARLRSAATAIARCWSSCCGAGSRKPKVVQKWWADEADREAGRSSCTTTSATATVQPYLAVVAAVPLRPVHRAARQGARSGDRPSAGAGTRSASTTSSFSPRRSSARTRTSAARCSRSIAGCSWTSSRTPIRSRPRSCSCWRRTRMAPAGALRPGALFVVGDPKQSIYRFRRADIDIYNEVRARLGGADGSGIVRLTTNFRSVPGLCTWANDVFKERFPATPTPQAPAFAPLHALPRSRRPDPRSPSSTCRRASRRRSCRRRRPRASRGTSARRSTPGAARYGDFLILTRKKNGAAAAAPTRSRRCRCRSRSPAPARSASPRRCATSRCCSARSPIRRMPSRSSASCAARSLD